MPMKPGMMMVMDKMSRYERQPRSEYGGDSERRMIGYNRDYETENRRRMEGSRMPYGMDEPEARRRRDSNGRYMEGGAGAYGYDRGSPSMGGYEAYPPSYGGGHDPYRMGGYGYGDEPEARRQRDSRGRFMMAGDPYMMDEEMRSQTWYPPYGGIPPQMHGGGSRYGFGDVYAHIQAPGAMNRPNMMESDMSAPVDEHTARMWVQKMDGGEHFKVEQTDQQRQAICPDCNRWEWYTAMNAMYSDHCETAKKLNVDRPDYYAHMAKDFLKDKDAKPNKLRRYMEHIAK